MGDGVIGAADHKEDATGLSRKEKKSGQKSTSGTLIVEK